MSKQSSWTLETFTFWKKNMPPLYNEHSHLHVIDWNEVAPYITPQRITPRMYEVLLFLARHLIREFAEAKRTQKWGKENLMVCCTQKTLRRARVPWKIVHSFSESRFSQITQLSTCRLSMTRRFEYVYCAQIISLLSETRIRDQCCIWSYTPALWDIGLLSWKGNRFRICVSRRDMLLNEQYITYYNYLYLLKSFSARTIFRHLGEHKVLIQNSFHSNSLRDHRITTQTRAFARDLAPSPKESPPSPGLSLYHVDFYVRSKLPTYEYPGLPLLIPK